MSNVDFFLFYAKQNVVVWSVRLCTRMTKHSYPSILSSAGGAAINGSRRQQRGVWHSNVRSEYATRANVTWSLRFRSLKTFSTLDFFWIYAKPIPLFDLLHQDRRRTQTARRPAACFDDDRHIPKKYKTRLFALSWLKKDGCNSKPVFSSLSQSNPCNACT